MGALGYLVWSGHKGHRSYLSKAPSAIGVVDFAGKWVQVQESSVEDLLNFYGRHEPICELDPEMSEKLTEEERADLEKQRALEVGSYRWLLADGDFDAWDPIQFIERMIMSQVGFIVVGGKPAPDLRR